MDILPFGNFPCARNIWCVCVKYFRCSLPLQWSLIDEDTTKYGYEALQVVFSYPPVVVSDVAGEDLSKLPLLLIERLTEPIAMQKSRIVLAIWNDADFTIWQFQLSLGASLHQIFLALQRSIIQAVPITIHRYNDTVYTHSVCGNIWHIYIVGYLILTDGGLMIEYVL